MLAAIKTISITNKSLRLTAEFQFKLNINIVTIWAMRKKMNFGLNDAIGAGQIVTCNQHTHTRMHAHTHTHAHKSKQTHKIPK